MNTSLTTSEREMLVMLLQKEEKNLLIEIHHTDHREFRSILKEKLQMVTTMIEKLKVIEPQVNF